MAYVRAMVHDPVLADDTFADVSVAIVQSYGNYDQTRPFTNWARGVARRVALANLRKHKGNVTLLDGTVLDAVGGELDSLGSETDLEARKQALKQCVQQLSQSNRKLVGLRYFQGMPYEKIAGLVRRSVNTLYVAFNRIHKALKDCLKKKGAAS